MYVKQGSILGPLAHLIACNDIPASAVACESVMYVDDDTDTVCDTKGVDLISEIQREADRSTAWISDCMVCAGDKTKFLVMGTYKQRRKLQQDNILSLIHI